MDWIKVKVKHAEYDMEAAPDNVYRAWIKLMTFVAFIERKPTIEQITARIGNDVSNALETYLITTGTTIWSVVDKVLEDVESVKYSRMKGKERQERYHNAHYNASITPLSTEADKKNKKNKIEHGFQPSSKPHNDPELANIIHKTVKEMKGLPV
jgi:hypothetical protein